MSIGFYLLEISESVRSRNVEGKTNSKFVVYVQYITFLFTLNLLRGSSCKNKSQNKLPRGYIVIYCPVATMKKFVQLMLYFRWLRNPWWRADIFRCSRRPEKGSLVCKHKRPVWVKTKLCIFIYKTFKTVFF